MKRKIVRLVSVILSLLLIFGTLSVSLLAFGESNTTAINEKSSNVIVTSNVNQAEKSGLQKFFDTIINSFLIFVQETYEKIQFSWVAQKFDELMMDVYVFFYDLSREYRDINLSLMG